MSKNVTLPMCFDDPADHIIWLKLDQRAANLKNGSAGFVCKDCTPEYKQEMMLQERCEHPEVEFGTVSRQMGGHVETEFAGFVRTPSGSRSFNGYLSHATEPEMAEGTGVHPIQD